MPNYRAISQIYPAVPRYLRARIWARKGDLLIYRPHQDEGVFSTDSLGFRHSVFEGHPVSVSEAADLPTYWAVLGSSHCFGFGLDGNHRTIASQLGNKLDTPCLNLSLPEANTADLGLAARQYLDPARLGGVVLLPGGSFTRFCYSGTASETDGPPPIHGPASAASANRNEGEPDALTRLIAYQSQAIMGIAAWLAESGVPFFVVDEMTFFEKREPSAAELNSQLGHAVRPEGEARFARHVEFIETYRQGLFPGLLSSGITVLPMTSAEGLNFIDEFHYDDGSIARICDALAPRIKAAAPQF